MKMKNLHKVYPNFQLITVTFKPHFYWKSFNNTTLIATIVIRASNTTRNYNNINIKNWHEIYPDFNRITATLKAHFYWKSLNDTTLMATIVISASNTMRNSNNISMKNFHNIYTEHHYFTATLKPHF